MKTRLPLALKQAGAIIPLVLLMGVGVAASLGLGTDDKGQEGGAPVFGLWEPFAPPENPLTEEKRVLGKILFWDEQLSSDNTMSCGTCHITEEGGVDPRMGVSPAFDGIFATEDDVMGSPGLIAADSSGEYLRSIVFDLAPQVTNRRSMSNFISMYAGNLFWDGRAEGNYIDPLNGDILAVSSAGLEIQSIMPILNDIEMAHQGRTWSDVTSKLEASTPLALASDIPPDMLNAINANGSYGALFEEAFGDPEITPARIGFALANYERTLVPNQSPWDLFVDGDPNGMTAKQQAGWDRLRNSACANCHVGALFSSMAFVTEGVRPVEEDRGRSEFSGTNFERGAFRMSTLRNLGIRDRFMHTGGLSTLDDVFDFYAHRNGRMPFFDNLDGRLFSPIEFSEFDEDLLKHFLNTALTDPRLASNTFPFDRPTLHTELPTANPMVSETGNAGTGGFTPEMIAITPPNIGNTGFKIGLDFGLGGAFAWVAKSSSPPVNGVVAVDELIGPITLNGMSAGDGYGTLIYPIEDTALEGETFYMQWIVADPNGKDGFARSQVAAVTPFCSKIAACVSECAADMNGDGELNFFDVSDYLAAFGASDTAADFNGDGEFNFFDVSAFLTALGAGCP